MESDISPPQMTEKKNWNSTSNQREKKNKKKTKQKKKPCTTKAFLILPNIKENI